MGVDKMKKAIISLAILAVGVGLTLQAEAAVTGKVTLLGTPKRGDVRINAAADPRCIHEGKFTTHHWKIGSAGELANVVISVTNAPEGGAVSSDKPLIDQKGCMYAPYATAIQVGQKVVIQNSDDTLHNVHAKAGGGKGKSIFNIGQPVKGMKTEKSFKKADIIKLKCDVHPWMLSYVHVFNHPYFSVTGEDGSFEISNLPDGEYTLQAWHSRFPEPATQTVKVSGGSAEVSFELDAANAK